MVADQKPPRVDDSERATLHALLHYQRASLVRKVTGVSDEAARQSPVTSGTNLLWLIRHMTRAESLWVLIRFAGEGDDLPDETVHETDTLASAVDLYRTTWERVDAVVKAAPSLAQPCTTIENDEPLNLRWVLMHLLEETARHAGHADILRELIDGQTGR